MAKFDDEKLADEKSVSQLNIGYAKLNNFSKVLAQTPVHEDKNVLKLGSLLKRLEKLFSFKKGSQNLEESELFLKLEKIQHNEFEKLEQEFEELNELNLPVEVVSQPQSNKILFEHILKTELLALKTMCELSFFEKDDAFLKQLFLKHIERLLVVFTKKEKDL